MNHPSINTSGLLIRASRGTLRRYASMLLLAAVLASMATARATDWGFNLIKGPTVETADGEILRMTGSGTFNPDSNTASGGGSFLAFNAFDEVPGTGIIRGTWEVTGFDNFSPDGGLSPGAQGGTLNIEILFSFEVGIVGGTLPGTLTVICPFDGVAFPETNDAIMFTSPFMPEAFIFPTDGFTAFHILKK
jgi:hypothetical protein